MFQDILKIQEAKQYSTKTITWKTTHYLNKNVKNYFLFPISQLNVHGHNIYKNKKMNKEKKRCQQNL